MFKRFKVTGINGNPKKPKRNWLKYLAVGCVIVLPAFALLKTGVLSMNKNVLAADQNKYDIVADLDGGKFEMGTTPEFTKMDNGNWLYRYKPVPTPTKLSTPIKDGYDFTGWTVSAKPDIQKEYSIPAWHKGNLNVKANWEPVEANLTLGSNFNSKIKTIDGIENVKTVIFDKMWDSNKGVDVSKLSNSVVKAWISGDTLHISSLKDVIYLNADSSQMFKDLKTIVKIDFGILDSSRLMVMNDMFSGCSSLTTGDFNSLNVSKVSDLSNVFNGCSSLHDINLSSWNTSNVTSMQQIFSGCSSLTSVDLSTWNTVKLVNMNGMFSQCSSITRINLSNFNTSSVTSMANMFNGCTVISSLDLTGLDMSAVTDFSAMFKGCNFLESLKANFDLVDVQNTSEMFMKCNNLKLNFTVNSIVQNYTNMFKNCSNLSGKVLVNYVSPETKEVARKMVSTKDKGDNVYLHEEPTILVNGTEFNKRIKGLSRFGDVTKIEFITKEIVPDGVDVSENNDGSIKAYVEGTTLYVASPAPVYANPDSSNMFNFKLTHSSHWEIGSTIGVPGGAGGGIVGKSLFARAKAFFMNLFAIRPEEPGSGYYTGIKVISLDNFDTSNVINMENMFRGCGGLVQIPVNELKTDKVTNMSGAFSYCATITDLDLSKLKTPVLQNMDGIFRGCSKLTNLNVDGLSTSKVTSLESVFEDCARLNQIDISSWDIGNVTNVSRLFAGCSKLSGDLTVTDEKITTYDYMFSDCSTDKNAKFIVKYKDDKTKELGRKMVATKNQGDHVYLDGDPLINGSMLVSGREFNSEFRSLCNWNYYDVKFVKQKPELDGIDLSKDKDKSIIGYLKDNIFYVASEKTIIANEDCSEMFKWSPAVNIIFENFDTSKVKNMESMFEGDDGDIFETHFGKIIGLEKFDVSNVVNMRCMFAGAATLKGIGDISNWDLSKIQDVTSMFYFCRDLSGEIIINNPNINNYGGMFWNCSYANNTKFTVKYVDDKTKELASKMVATKNQGDHVYLDGDIIDSELLAGSEFNSAILSLPGFINVEEIHFVKEEPDINGVSVSGDGDVKACIDGNILKIASKNNIVANTDCSTMFKNLDKIKLILFNNFNASKISKFHQMFIGCTNLEDLKNLSFDGCKVEFINDMFSGCKKLKQVDLTGIDFSRVRTGCSMFRDCISLKKIIGLEKLNTKEFIDGAYMFNNCNNLSGSMVITNGYFGWDEVLGDYVDMFTGCSSAPNAKFIVIYKSYAGSPAFSYLSRALSMKNPEDKVYLYSGGEPATLMPGSQFRNTISKINGINNVTEIKFVRDTPDKNGISVAMEGIAKAHIENSTLIVASEGDIIANQNCRSMLAELENIKTITFENFDTSNTSDMSYMFRNAVALTNLDLSGFDTSGVSRIHNMFSGCRSLTSLNLKGFNTLNIANMSNMFSGCSELTYLDLSSFDMTKVDEVGGMFYRCSKLTSEITIKNSFAMIYNDGDCGMFQGCSSDQNAKFIVKYASPEAKELARKMVATKNPGDHVYLDGELDDAILLAGTDFNAKVKTLANYNNVTRAEFNKVTAASAKPGSVDVSSTRAPIYAYIEGNTLKIESSKQIYANKDAAKMFAGTDDKSSPYTEIVFNNFDTSKVKWLYGMFANCKNLTSVDVSGFNTSNVTDMAIVFKNCSKLTNLDISKWDMSKAARTRMMFTGCSELTTIVHSPLVTSANTDTYGMFAQCPKLTSINTAGWDVSNVTNMAHMFRECSNLSTVDVSNWDVSHVTDMESMFYLDSNLNQLDVSNWRPASATNMYYMFKGCSRLETLATTNWVTTSVVTTTGMFWDCKNLKTLDVTYWDTSNLKESASMFRDCAALTELNVGNWNTSSLTESGVMFNGCKSLKQLNVENWDVSKVTNMNSMFRSCENLVSLDLSKWDVSKVTDLADMFCDDYNLVSLNVSGWNTSNVTNMSQIFMSCYRLQYMDLSSWNTMKVTTFRDLFYDCNEVTLVKLGSGWDTSNVTNMQGMFYRCLKLTSLDLSTFNTSKVTTFEAMFAQDKELTSINNNNFNLSSATNTTRMFANNRKLNGSIKINNPSISLYTNMFYDCSCLNSSRFNVYYTPEAQSMAQTLVNTKTSNDNVVLAGIRSVVDESADPEPAELSQQQDSTNQYSVESTSNTVTITLNNGPSAMYPVQKIQTKAGKLGDLPKPDLNPKYAGQFGGYYYDKNCTIPVKPNDIVTQDIELYAKW